MRKSLYTIKIYKENEFSRDKAVKLFNAVMRTRKVFGLAVSTILNGRKISTVSSNAINALIKETRDYRGRYKSLFEPQAYPYIQRVYRGRLLEKRLYDDRKETLKALNDEIRFIRRAEKLNDDHLIRRKPFGLLKEFQTKRLRLPKRPKNNAEYVGIEIECIVPQGVDLTPLLPFAKYVEVGSDGSIDHRSNEEGLEIRVCMIRKQVREVLPDLMAALKSMGARINKSCGLHVHLDQRNNEEPEKVFQKLVRSLGLLYTIVPESRRSNRYCKRNRHADFAEACNGDRYKAINASAFRRYYTIEVRLFGGTLESSKIINWIEILTAISQGETVMRCPKTFDTAMKYWKLSPENLAWAKERQARFSSLNAGMPVSEHETEENQMLLDENQEDVEECDCNQEECEVCNSQAQRDAIRRQYAARQRAEIEAGERARLNNIDPFGLGNLVLNETPQPLLSRVQSPTHQYWINQVVQNPCTGTVNAASTFENMANEIQRVHVQEMERRIIEGINGGTSNV